MSGNIVAGRHGRPPQPLEEVPQEYAAFKVEQRGIELIPDAERKMRPSGAGARSSSTPWCAR